ncbi:hypothetical protein [Lacticaseibacillus saniviri]|uniref:Uncharacterized protein n=1 Tax=Lacticaseibacillus saniviri JCM 17471 = DSM 24301 TaxID=1293598 RepID=A0A0R2MQ83_9LACO|nr:hypothetical protein [Lacticaseibacillus saniviri]KRO15783.1 hypothetical protein IV56_GL002144 [Lacticaseibacillus saniviri JCM 17471 = DSM 24301]
MEWLVDHYTFFLLLVLAGLAGALVQTVIEHGFWSLFDPNYSKEAHKHEAKQ